MSWWGSSVVNSHKSGGGEPGEAYDALKTRGLEWHDRGNSGFENYSEDQVNEALGILGRYDIHRNDGALTYQQNLRAMKSSFDAQHAQEEYQAAMLEMYDRMAAAAEESARIQEEAANKAVNYEQPINDVSIAAAYSKADREAENRQALRRGLLSLTRYGDQGAAKRQTLGAA